MGQNQPQKSLPKVIVRKTTIKEINKEPLREWVEIKVLKRAKGSILKNMSKGKVISSPPR